MANFNPYMERIDMDFWRDLCREEGVLRRYAKGDFFLRAGEFARHFGFIESGCFKYTVVDSIGEERITGFAPCHNLAGDFYSAVRQAFFDDELFVMENEGGIVASAILNNKQPSAYSLINWDHEVEPSKVGVIHTLAVDPMFSHAGYGRLFVAFFEDYCRQKGWTVARLDTQSKNTVAMSFYPKLGYKFMGTRETVFCDLPQEVNLAMFEKEL